MNNANTPKLECADIEAKLNAYTNGQLESTEQAAMTAHICQCSACEKSLRAHADYQAAIESIEIPEPSDEYLASMVRKACMPEAHTSVTPDNVPQSKPQKHWWSFAGGFVAASVLAFAVLLSTNIGQQEAALAPSVAFFEDETQELIVVLNVPADMPKSRLEFNLPQDVAVAGYEHLDTIDWVIDLKKGENTFVLPLEIAPYVNLNNGVQLQASINFGSKKKVFLLEIASPEHAEVGDASA